MDGKGVIMRRASAAIAFFTVSILATALPASATYHIIVIDQIFPGIEEAPHAQYVMVRTQAPLQTAVFGQPLPVFDAAGNPLGTFGTFCTTPKQSCVLPAVSPACSAGGCPQPFDANKRHILVATPWAQDLFCVTADLVATGVLPFPNGRVCWGECSVQPEPPTCTSGPVDCLAYGNFTGNNSPFGSPAMAPMLGEALVADPERMNQFLMPNDPLLDDSLGFSAGTATPENFHGDQGAIDGLAGDPDGNGSVDASDVDAELDVLFETDNRCSLPTTRRGADANFDTRVSAADVIATIRIVTPAG
jgi:hypothetical protein